MAHPSTAFKHPSWRSLPTTIRTWWTSLSQVEIIFIGLALLRIMIVLVFMLNILPLERRFGWYLQHGGDQNEFLELAISIIQGGDLYVTIVAIGPALLYVPWIMLLYSGDFGGEYLAQIYFTIAPAMVVINGFIIGGLSVIVMGVLTRRLTKNDAVAVISAAIWAILPFLMYFAFFWHPEASLLRSANVPKVGWLNGLSDGPATFFVMVGVMLLAIGLDDGKRQPAWRMILLGVAIGAALTFRVHISTMLALMLLFVVVAYSWRTLPAIALGGAVAYLPQAWYNTLQFGIPVTTGYLSAHYVWAEEKAYEHMTVLERLPFGPSHLIELFQYHIGRRPWVLIPILIAFLVAAALVFIVWKKLGWRQVVLLIGIPLVYLLPMMATWPFRDDVIRFAMPAYPYFIIMFVYFGWLAYEQVQKWRAQKQPAPHLQ